MGSQPARRSSRRVFSAAVESDERRSWLSYGLAGLGISALGLAAAGSLALSTSASTTPKPAQTRTQFAVSAPAKAASSGSGVSTQQATAVNTFSRRPNLATADANRSAALRTAIVKEQAAQRAEELAKEADDITSAARTATSDARQDQLTAADRASQLAAAKLAREKLRRAVAARIAASLARQARDRSEDSGPSYCRSSESGSSDAGSSNTRSNDSGSSCTSASSRSSTSGGAASPVPGAVIRARFGQYGVWSRYHTGLDFAAAYGTPIRAVKSGTVLFAGNKGNWAGNHVAIRHGDGRTTMSSHMSSMAVGSGQSVQAGQVIGYVGQTGRAFGAHLHFELYPAGVRYGDVYRAINPQPWLQANGVQTR